MADFVEALTFKLQSKICYHSDASADFREIKTYVDKLIEENKRFRDEKSEYLDLINRVIEEKEKFEHGCEAIKEQVALLEEQLNTVKKDLSAWEHELVAIKEELVTEKHGNVVAKEELVAVKKQLVAEKQQNVAAKEKLVVAEERLAQRNVELEVLRKKLQESEAMHNQLHQQKGSAPGSEPVHSRRVTRSIYKMEMLLQGSLLNGADINHPRKRMSYPQLPIDVQRASRGDDLEVLRQMLIKGLTEIDAGQHLGLKEMGKLSEKPFRDACAMKLPPSQSGARAFELYTLWQALLNNPNWRPFKTVTVDGKSQEVIDVDDDKLQGLKMAWGEGPYNSVIRALVERKENKCDGTVDMWNYKEGRKATIGEFVEHILDKLKQFRLKTY